MSIKSRTGLFAMKLIDVMGPLKAVMGCATSCGCCCCVDNTCACSCASTDPGCACACGCGCA